MVSLKLIKADAFLVCGSLPFYMGVLSIFLISPNFHFQQFYISIRTIAFIFLSYLILSNFIYCQILPRIFISDVQSFCSCIFVEVYVSYLYSSMRRIKVLYKWTCNHVVLFSLLEFFIHFLLQLWRSKHEISFARLPFTINICSIVLHCQSKTLYMSLIGYYL